MNAFRHWPIIALLLVSGAVAIYWKGRVDERAVFTAAGLEQEIKNSAVADKLAATEEANRKLARSLEDQAYAEPPSASCGLPASRVLRLNER